MKPLRISMNGLALELHVPITRISEIVNERRGFTADTALRLAPHDERANEKRGTVTAYPNSDTR